MFPSGMGIFVVTVEDWPREDVRCEERQWPGG